MINQLFSTPNVIFRCKFTPISHRKSWLGSATTFLLLFLLSTQVLALDSTIQKQQVEKSLSKYYAQKLADLDTLLLVKGTQLAQDPSKLTEFVNNNILNLWSSAKTLKLMLGAKNWKMLSEAHIAELEKAFDETVHRYVKEGMGFYDGQRAKFLSVEVNDKLNKGFLTVELQPTYLPAFNIVFKITKTDSDWKLYDIFVEGISYIKMKKNGYRRMMKDNGPASLINYLNSKNSQ